MLTWFLVFTQDSVILKSSCFNLVLKDVVEIEVLGNALLLFLRVLERAVYMLFICSYKCV